MPDNLGFDQKQGEDVKQGKSDPPNSSTNTTGTNTENNPDEQTSSMWGDFLDIIGTRQKRFIEELRPLKKDLNLASQHLRELQTEIDRQMITHDVVNEAVKSVETIIKKITKITSEAGLNVPPEENQKLRDVNLELVVLKRIIRQLLVQMNLPRKLVEKKTEIVNEGDPDQANKTKKKNKSDGETSENIPLAPSEEQMPENKTDDEKDDHVPLAPLKERITNNNLAIKELLRFIDKKTQRRWWLRDVVNFLKFALFVSATISVVYHETQTAPIFTLCITIVQGLLEIIDQFFIQSIDPAKIDLSTLASTGDTKS